MMWYVWRLCLGEPSVLGLSLIHHRPPRRGVGGYYASPKVKGKGKGKGKGKVLTIWNVGRHQLMSADMNGYLRTSPEEHRHLRIVPDIPGYPRTASHAPDIPGHPRTVPCALDFPRLPSRTVRVPDPPVARCSAGYASSSRPAATRLPHGPMEVQREPGCVRCPSRSTWCRADTAGTSARCAGERR